MRLMLGSYEVEIKARGYGASRMNPEDTKAFLNELSIAYDRASAQAKADGYMSIAEHDHDKSDAIYYLLDGMGYYDSVRKNA